MILHCLEVVVMLNKKFILLSIILCCSSILSVNAETLSDLEFPKPPAYRVGISELPENQYVQAKQERNNIEKINKIGENKESSNTDITYADLSIKKLSKEIAQELEFDEAEMVADLSLLWQGAAMQSDTINFALYKLANNCQYVNFSRCKYGKSCFCRFFFNWRQYFKYNVSGYKST